ncbi:MAG: heat-inducible transcription repressor HrcA [Nitrospirae bacterium]|nr:MAG: heat-inducible transcription repressor HrcA [Nitrospirota bacterium]
MSERDDIGLDVRSARVLRAVIRSYIENPEPVGSRTLTKKYGLEWSPATIRNIMADLEEMGFLMQPHTSAGRVPTDLGYRYYVEHMVQDEPVEGKGEVVEFEHFGIETEDLGRLLDLTTDTLSKITRYLGLGVSPGAEGSVLRHVDFVPYKDDSIVVILVTEDGIIKHKIVKNDYNLSRNDLRQISSYINRQFTGYTIKEIRDRIVEEMFADKRRFDDLVSRAMEVYRDVLYEYDSNIFLSGMTRILDLPDFSDLRQIKDLTRTIENKHALVKLIDQIMNADGLQIVIGTENPVEELQGMSVVASTYTEGDRKAGVIGIIGPKRMEYATTISLVEAAARFLSSLYDEGGRGWKKKR